MNKKKLTTLLVFGILYVTYAVVLFLLNKNYQLSFWLSFGFITASVLFMLLSFTFASKDGRSQQVVGMPVNVLSSIYFGIEFVLGTILMIFPALSFAAVFVPQFVLLALYLVCFVPAILSDNNYKSVEIKAEEKKEEQQ